MERWGLGVTEGKMGMDTTLIRIFVSIDMEGQCLGVTERKMRMFWPTDGREMEFAGRGPKSFQDLIPEQLKQKVQQQELCWIFPLVQPSLSKWENPHLAQNPFVSQGLALQPHISYKNKENHPKSLLFHLTRTSTDAFLCSCAPVLPQSIFQAAFCTSACSPTLKPLHEAAKFPFQKCFQSPRSEQPHLPSICVLKKLQSCCWNFSPLT